MLRPVKGHYCTLLGCIKMLWLERKERGNELWAVISKGLMKHLEAVQTTRKK